MTTIYKNLNDLTILIPTQDRSYFLDRAFLFYSSLNFNCRFIVGDSSTTKNFIRKAKEVCYKYRNTLNIEFYNYNSDVSFGGKLNLIANKSKTEFTAIIGDDDVFINTGIDECINYLRKKNDTVAAFGHRITFKIESKVNNTNDWYCLNQIRSKGLESNDYKERIQVIDTQSWSNFLYAVYRSETIKNSLGVIKNLKYNIPTENLLYYSILISGKWKKIDTLFSVIGFESKFFRYKLRSSFPDYWANNGTILKQLSKSTFSKDFDKGISNIQILFKNKIDMNEVRESILISFWSNNTKYLNEKLGHIHLVKKKLLSYIFYKLYLINYKLWHYFKEYSLINFLGILCKELFRPYFWKILLRKKQNSVTIDQEEGVSKNYIFIIKTIIHHKSLDCTDVALLSEKGKYYSVFIPAFKIWKKYPFGIKK